MMLMPVMTRVLDVTPASLSDVISDTDDIAVEVFSIGSKLVTFVTTNWICLVPLALAILYFGFCGIRKLIKGV